MGGPTELGSAKAVDLVPSEAQSSVIRDHGRVSAKIRSAIIMRIVVATVDLENDPSAVGEEE